MSVATQARLVEVDGRALAYSCWGDPDGLPVLSLHGTPGGRLYRNPDDDLLARTGARLITYDRPGYGRSDRAAGRRVVDCARDVEALADALDLDRFAVVGTSGGGPHCLAVAALLPDRVLRARAVVSVAPFDAEGLSWFAGMDVSNVREFAWAVEGEAVLRPELERMAADFVRRAATDPSTVLGDYDLSPEDQLAMQDAQMQELLAQAVPETFARGVSGWVDEDLAFVQPWGFDVRDIRVPVEIWYGAADVLVPAAHGAWLADNVPGAEVRVDTRAGHLSRPAEGLRALAALVQASR